jgi:hypothetical protein
LIPCRYVARSSAFQKVSLKASPSRRTSRSAGADLAERVSRSSGRLRLAERVIQVPSRARAEKNASGAPSGSGTSSPNTSRVRPMPMSTSADLGQITQTGRAALCITFLRGGLSCAVAMRSAGLIQAPTMARRATAAWPQTDAARLDLMLRYELSCSSRSRDRAQPDRRSSPMTLTTKFGIKRIRAGDIGISGPFVRPLPWSPGRFNKTFKQERQPEYRRAFAGWSINHLPAWSTLVRGTDGIVKLPHHLQCRTEGASAHAGLNGRNSRAAIPTYGFGSRVAPRQNHPSCALIRGGMSTCWDRPVAVMKVGRFEAIFRFHDAAAL